MVVNRRLSFQESSSLALRFGGGMQGKTLRSPLTDPEIQTLWDQCAIRRVSILVL